MYIKYFIFSIGIHLIFLLLYTLDLPISKKIIFKPIQVTVVRQHANAQKTSVLPNPNSEQIVEDVPVTTPVPVPQSIPEFPLNNVPKSSVIDDLIKTHQIESQNHTIPNTLNKEEIKPENTQIPQMTEELNLEPQKNESQKIEPKVEDDTKLKPKDNDLEKSLDRIVQKQEKDNFLNSLGLNENRRIEKKQELTEQVLSKFQASVLNKQLSKCWFSQGGYDINEDLTVRLKLTMNKDASIQHIEVLELEQYNNSSKRKVILNQVLRALKNPECNPLLIPKEDYYKWRIIYITFKPERNF